MSRHAQGDLTDQLVIDAICMRLSAGIEALGRLEEYKAGPTVRRCLADHLGMRNRIAHGYLLVDTDIVRRTVEHDIPPILTSIEAELTGVD